MDLSLCIVTTDVPILRRFYESVLASEAVGDDDYCEFVLGSDWRVALCSLKSIEFAAPGAHIPGTNRCMRIEVRVTDVDAECERLRGVVTDWVTPPTSWPWGTRAAWFRDPDGNLISLYEVPAP